LSLVCPTRNDGYLTRCIARGIENKELTEEIAGKQAEQESFLKNAGKDKKKPV